MHLNRLTPYLWLLPFIGFLLGYQLLYLLQPKTTLPAPNLVGEPLATALKTLAAQQLNLRVSAEQIDPSLPEQVIISQKPYAGQALKPNQTVYVVITRKPQATTTPLLIGKTADQVQAELQALGLKQQAYFVPSTQPSGSCIAQQPEPGQPTHKNHLLTYFSSSAEPPLLMPDLRQLSLAEVSAFLTQHQVPYTIVNLPGHVNPHVTAANDPDHTAQLPRATPTETTIPEHADLISDHRPRPGTLVQRAKLAVQLKVAPVS